MIIPLRKKSKKTPKKPEIESDTEKTPKKPETESNTGGSSENEVIEKQSTKTKKFPANMKAITLMMRPLKNLHLK
jgi:hypothetical protein